VGKTVGMVGTGQIGATFAKIMHGFGCSCWPTTVSKSEVVALGARYLSLPDCWHSRGSSACIARSMRKANT
jgi:D-lactate dehydrogenase